MLAHVRERLRHHGHHGRRVLLGFDFAYGYPSGFAAALGLTGAEAPWRRVWNELTRRIEERENNANNRFEVASELNAYCPSERFGPFWGCPDHIQRPWLSSRRPPMPYRLHSGLTLPEFRETEQSLPGTKSTWQLYGNGAVGGQTLVGIPAVAALRDDPDLRAISRVWPFETGFGLDAMPLGTPAILHVEIWPGVVKHLIPPAPPIPDKELVRAMVEWLADLDAANELMSLFSTPAGLSGDRLRQAVREEGWILGSGH